MLPRRGLIDHHCDDDAGVRRGSKTHEGRDVPGDVTPAFKFVGSTGLARHTEPRNLRFWRRATWAGGQFKHVSNGSSSLGLHDPLTDGGLFAF